MHILQVHNSYINRGGEDVVLEREKKLLINKGLKVSQYVVSNEVINSLGKRFTTVMNLPYSLKYKNELMHKLEHLKPDLVHLHNFFPLLTPSILYACHKKKVPVVLTIHNYRLLCINGLLYRDNKPCEKCIDKQTPLPGVLHKCYRNSVFASVMPVISNTIHNHIGTWENQVQTFIFLSPFTQSIFKKSHIQNIEEKAVIKPNFVEDKGFNLHKEDSYLFAGRLSEEKGIKTVLEAFSKNIKTLFIAGEGPLKSLVKDYDDQYNNINYLGFQNSKEMTLLLKRVKALVFSSVCYEGALSLVIIEAFSCGTPVIASNLGNSGFMVKNHVTGLTFDPKNAQMLIATIEEFENLDLMTLSKNARKEYENKYTPEKNALKLINVYKETIHNYKGKNLKS